VTLSKAQLQRAEAAGEKRYKFHRSRPTKHRTGLATTNASYDITGAVGELAIALYVGVADEWVDFTPDFSSLPADIGSDLQVRTGRHPRSKPFLYDNMKPEQRFAFARRLESPEKVELVGWCWVGEAQQEQWWKQAGSRPPVYWPPNSVFYPMQSLLLCERQCQLWQNYEHLLAMGSNGLNGKYEASLLKRLDWWVDAELEYRKAQPKGQRYAVCLWGKGRTCPDAVACCTACAITGAWSSKPTASTVGV
jgi:hypothetical protein